MMPAFVYPRTLDFERYRLIEPRPDGPVLGFYGGRPIAAAVVDYFGRRYVYAGVAAHDRLGRLDACRLRPGEWLVEPGLVYRRA